MREGVVRMTKQELERWQVIQRVLRGELTQVLAGEALGLSERQVRRMVKKVRRRGARALAHASRGLESPRKMAEALEDRIAEIIRSRYPDFSPLHAAEKLSEHHRIEVSREKVRQVMMAKGLWRRQPLPEGRIKFFRTMFRHSSKYFGLNSRSKNNLNSLTDKNVL